MQKAKRSTPGLVETTANAASHLYRPKYLRLPRTGSKCPVSGLSRTAIFMLIKAGAVRSVVIRRAGASRGTRLVSYESLVGYLRRLEKEQNSRSLEGQT